MGGINRISRIFDFRNTFNTKGAYVSKSQKLFTEKGLTHFNDGVGTLMPFLVKSLRKLETIVHKEMREIGASEFMLPTLTDSVLLKKSGRAELTELFRVNETGNKNYLLSPTCEEAVTNLITLYKPVHNAAFPIRLYQISTKFRDEKRGRCGLLRSKEFVMKDLYCFDKSSDDCEECYQEIINQYHHFFDILKVPYVCVEGDTGSIGGLKSHEFYFLSDAGEDKLAFCKNCGHGGNINNKPKHVTAEVSTSCPNCQSNNVTVENAIEVGHTFNLGTRFTKPFNATFKDKDNEEKIIHMNCFGLGLTRILAASAEVLSKPEEIIWPISIAPYLVCIIPPKAGSKEEKDAGDATNVVYHSLNQCLEDDIIIDDRTSFTIGKRLQFTQALGFPFHVVIGKSILEDPPKVEVLDCTGSKMLVQIPDLKQFILDRLADLMKVDSQKEKISL